MQKAKIKNGSLTTMMMVIAIVPLILKKAVPQMMKTNINMN